MEQQDYKPSMEMVPTSMEMAPTSMEMVPTSMEMIPTSMDMIDHSVDMIDPTMGMGSPGMEMGTPATPMTPIDNHELPDAETLPNKRRRKKSIVWEHFTVETVGPGHTRACCNQCKKSFAYITGSKLAGTSHLKRHIALGICPVSRQRNQSYPYTSGLDPGNATVPPKRRYRSTPAYPRTPFDQDRCNLEIAKMIIQHDYPLNIVEHQGFIDFVHTLQPQFNMVSFNTVQGDCVAIYLREKQSLLNFISGVPGKVSLTLNMCTSSQNLGYVFLTGHFMDGNLNLHRRILNVVMVPNPDSDDALNQAIVNCLSDWHLEGRIFTLTLDQSFSNQTVLEHLRGFLSVKNPHMLSGQLVIGNCYARAISQLAQYALATMSETVKKIRESVKYVKTSDTHEEKFLELKEQLQAPSNVELSMDDLTKWNTTYHMLVAAWELKEVFSCLDECDADYKMAPSADDWNQVEILCTYLKHFFDAANIVTDPLYPPASTFFHEVWKIQLELTLAATSEDPFVSSIGKPLLDKFDKYWKETCLVLSAGVVMDPRFKMKLVIFSFSKIYGEEAETWTKVIEDSVHELFLEYVAHSLTLPGPFVEEGDESILKDNNNNNNNQQEDGHFLTTAAEGLQDFEEYISELSSGQQMKSELEQYLEEPLLPRVHEFDVLGWWRENKSRYPTLSRMASDILSIPFSTVDSDYVFDTKSKKVDGYQKSLRPVTLEALVCAKDWLQYGMLPEMEPSNMPTPIVKSEF